jgi:hypothetical protein
MHQGREVWMTAMRWATLVYVGGRGWLGCRGVKLSQ